MKSFRVVFVITMVFVVGLLLSSCNKAEFKTSSTSERDAETQVGLLSEEEAVVQVQNLYGALFGKGLRSESTPEVLSVQKTSVPQDTETREGEGVFVVNFKDNRGYVVLSTSKYNEPIIAANDHGFLDISVPTSNMNLIPVLSNTDAILKHGSKLHFFSDLEDVDGIPKRDGSATDQYKYEIGAWEIVLQVDPLVRVEWNQGEPHNTKLQKINGKYPPVGCVATAVSQIMSYYRFPRYDWDRIIADVNDSYSREVLSTLHRDLGKPQYLNMHYDLNGSGANSANVPRTFRAYGYQSSDLCDYSWETICAEITARRPVFVSAYRFKHETTTPKFLFWGGKTEVSYSGGHAWVLDGIKKVRRWIRFIDKRTREVEVSYQTKELVHCNFGWGKLSNNGYYLSKAFDALKGPVMRGESNIATSGQKYNYQYNHKIVKDIKVR